MSSESWHSVAVILVVFLSVGVLYLATSTDRVLLTGGVFGLFVLGLLFWLFLRPRSY